MSKIILQQVSKFHRTVAKGITIAAILMVDRVAVTVGAVVKSIYSTGVVLGGVDVAAIQVTEAIVMMPTAAINHPIIFAVIHGDIISTSTSLHLVVKLKYAHKHDYQDSTFTT
jgi:hypothetical protein